MAEGVKVTNTIFLDGERVTREIGNATIGVVIDKLEGQQERLQLRSYTVGNLSVVTLMMGLEAIIDEARRTLDTLGIPDDEKETLIAAAVAKRLNTQLQPEVIH